MKVLGEGEKRLTNGFGIVEDIGDIPLDEIMSLGIGLTAAVAAALVMEETWNRLNQTTDEKIRLAEEKLRTMKAVSDETQQWTGIVIQLAEKITSGIVTAGYGTVLSAQRPIDEGSGAKL